jgi:uncharacterized protein
MEKDEAIEIVRAYKKLLSKYMSFEKMYLFGSYAKEAGNEHSDIDVAVVVNSAEGDFFEVNPLLWKVRRQIDDRIEPVLIEAKYDDAGFLDEIQRTGIEIDCKSRLLKFYDRGQI